MNSRFTRRAALEAKSSSTVPSMSPTLMPSTMRRAKALFSSDMDAPPHLSIIRMMPPDEAEHLAYTPMSYVNEREVPKWSGCSSSAGCLCWRGGGGSGGGGSLWGGRGGEKPV